MPSVDPDMVGEVWSPARPFKELKEYGHVSMTPSGAFEIRSYQTFTLVYTAGAYGLDDTGSLQIVFRFPMDFGEFQITNLRAENFVTAQTTAQADLSVDYFRTGHTRPRDKCLRVSITGGCLAEGDTISLVLGDISGGGPGMKLQTFCETALEFTVLVDIYATGHFVPLPQTPWISVIPGKPAFWKAVLPTLVRPDETFALALKAEDVWGNPSDQVDQVLLLRSRPGHIDLPQRIHFPPRQKALRLEGLSAHSEGIYQIEVRDEQGTFLTESNPMLIRESPHRAFWGDLHGQSGETVGINSAREYFSFAKDLAFLDVASHQGNDFQINNRFWQELNSLTAEFNESGSFVALPGYEWSGNTPIGGDHNVFFLHDYRPIRRSSHALLTDRSDIDSDAKTLKELFDALRDEESVVFAHVGGRYADIAYAHDPHIETALEIHSDWGTFEWLLTDSFRLGYRCGVVCNSDGHKGRPGASHPGAADFGAYGGLTCFLAKELTREAVFDCLRHRRHYGTSGNRIHLDVRTRFQQEGLFFEQDPRYHDIRPHRVKEIMMGDIAQTEDEAVDFCVEAASGSPIERIDVLNGESMIATLRGYTERDLDRRIRVLCCGAKYRGRSRKTRWVGNARIRNAKILNLKTINVWNHELPFEQQGDDQVIFELGTTGNFAGFDIWLDSTDIGRLELETNLVSADLALDDISLEDTVFEAGGLGQCLKVFRLPDNNPHRQLKAHVPVKLLPQGDNPLWVRVTTEDGFNAWSSPMFVYRNPS